jgi:pyridoxamine 5'-phosphate oxidase
VLLWHQLQRQVRIEGRVGRVDAAQSDTYFGSRPRGAQIGAAASLQSRPIEDREALEAQVAGTEHTFDGRDVERPEQWGGYRIALEAMEFWQGRPNRVHDRLRFARSGQGWSRERLQP